MKEPIEKGNKTDKMLEDVLKKELGTDFDDQALELYIHYSREL